MSTAKSIEIEFAETAIAELRPRWDKARRELWLQADLVKRLRVPAANQDVVLLAFEMRGWPPRIDDPLPRDPNIDSVQRLQTTIKRLNGGQIKPLIQFSGDGRGAGLLWKIRIIPKNMDDRVLLPLNNLRRD